MKFIPSPGMVACPKCGGQYDPRIQSAACHRGVRHYRIKRVSEWRPPPPLPVPAEKPKPWPPLQADFRSLWDERQ